MTPRRAPGRRPDMDRASWPQLLLIDDDPVVGRLMKAVFTPESIEVTAVETADQGLRSVVAAEPQVVILDLRLPDMTGLELLEKLQAQWPQLPVIVLTGRVEVKTAVQAMQLGAAHYLTKPMDREELVLVVQRALERRALLREVGDLRRQATPASGLAQQMGPSAQVQQVIEQVSQVAESDLTVLIVGETGTGKELVAQAIHRQSRRHQRPLIAVDCGAIPEALLESELFGHEKGAYTGADRRRRGQFQLAEGGTLFLDETANLPAPLQPKLLRVLESRELRSVGSTERAPIDVRIVAATNVALQSQVRQGRFREDLYFRLAQFTIRLPPLRERPKDIPHLVERFAGEICLELKRPIAEITPQVIGILQCHHWPGNVRELRNVVRQAVVRCRSLVIDAALIEALLRDHGTELAAPLEPFEAGALSLREISGRAVEAAERRAICAALHGVHGNKSAAAKQLHTDYKTLFVKIRRYAITPRDYAEV